MTKTIARLIAAASTAAALATVAVGAPAQATAPTSPTTFARTPAATFVLKAAAPQTFHVEYGASVTDGTVTFSNRSVNISGYVKAVSDSRTVLFVGFNGNGSCYFEEPRTTPAGTTRRFEFNKQCNVAGGFTEVLVFFPA
jgi:hypothetical protein